MSDGKGCICAARYSGECSCDADWTPQEVIDRDVRIKSLEAELRYWLWMGHGCQGLYGDDGEMQCNNAKKHGKFLDFKRDPLDELQSHVTCCKIVIYAENQALKDEVARLKEVSHDTKD